MWSNSNFNYCTCTVWPSGKAQTWHSTKQMSSFDTAFEEQKTNTVVWQGENGQSLWFLLCINSKTPRKLCLERTQCERASLCQSGNQILNPSGNCLTDWKDSKAALENIFAADNGIWFVSRDEKITNKLQCFAVSSWRKVHVFAWSHVAFSCSKWPRRFWTCSLNPVVYL